MSFHAGLRAAAAIACVTMTSVPASAGTRLDIDGVRACVATAIDLGKNPTGCVEQAHAPCLTLPGDTPNVTSLCFTQVRDEWSTAISAQMDRLAAEAPERVAALAGIEVKYDLLSALVQCDRLEEIAQLRELAAQDIALQKSRCTATASGLAYIRLLWRMPTPDPSPPKEKDQ